MRRVFVGGLDVVDRRAVGAKQRRLMTGGQKAAGEVLQAAARDDAEAQHDEAGQIVVLAAQAVVDPRAKARPAGVVEPVCRNSTPVECIGRSAFIERMTARSSAHVAMCGNRLLTGIPHSPCCVNFHGLFSHCRLPLAVGFFDSVNGLPSSSSSFGLGSNESTCETPPSMKQKMTFFAFGSEMRFRQLVCRRRFGAQHWHFWRITQPMPPSRIPPQKPPTSRGAWAGPIGDRGRSTGN